LERGKEGQRHVCFWLSVTVSPVFTRGQDTIFLLRHSRDVGPTR
jgi:hypothetical protein